MGERFTAGALATQSMKPTWGSRVVAAPPPALFAPKESCRPERESERERDPRKGQEAGAGGLPASSVSVGS